MNAEFIGALEQIEKEKNISKEVLIDAIEAALISAYKRNFGSSQNVSVNIDRITGEVRVYANKRVVEVPENDLTEISLGDARNISEKYDIGDVVEIEVTPKKFGRIAAQTAKQVVVQRIREAERGIIYDEFFSKQNDIVTGIVVPGETYNFNDRIKVYVIEVKKTTKGPQVLISRTHPGLIKRLFEKEVPEIYDGIVEIKSISREPGSRTKIAVHSIDPNVDPVGACVGQKGNRVQVIVDELRGEKIDIVKWSSDPSEYISASLSPAKVLQVEINESEKSAKVIVPDYQLSLAIGKEGQNARLAAKLTGWKIDIKSESQSNE
ncbi:MAG: transcription termination/antitermination protein NusA [Clostridiales bacterium]|nr:transcription termination/antitermination protein NusA [Clostridiales bacterium]